jgi:putative ABC transport system permease protein
MPITVSLQVSVAGWQESRKIGGPILTKSGRTIKIGSFVKSALRNLWIHRGFTFINIAGLSVGLASSFIIMLYAINELSYDAHNDNLSNIYLVTAEWASPPSTALFTPFVAGPALKGEYPEVQEFARFMRGSPSIKYKDKSFERSHCLCADPSIFRILTLPVESGSLEGIATERNFAVISNQMAHKIFGDANPIGEIITVNWLGKPYDLKIGAVMKDIPQTSSLRAEVIMPLSVAQEWFTRLLGPQAGNMFESWSTPSFPTFVLLSHSTSQAQLETMMKSFSKRHVNAGVGPQFHLFPMKDLYFHSSTLSGNPFPSGNISTVYVYSAIAILILLIACFNLVILSTGRASVRTKEIAVRKVVGASRLDLMKQIMLESLLVAVLSLPIALVFVELFLPTLSQHMGNRLPETFFHGLKYLILFSGITLLAGVLSGSYVSFYLSGFSPVDILHSKASTGASKVTLRRIMLAIQMVIFVGLVTASLAIYRQVDYFHSKDMGFEKEDLIVLASHRIRVGSTSDPSRFDITRFETFKSELLSNPSITGVTGAQHLPGRDGGKSSIIALKSDPSRKVNCEELSVDRNFIETMKMHVVYGKSFAEVAPEESRHSVIVNESAVKAFGFSDLSKETIRDQRILGVVKDFNMRSLREPISPVIIQCDTSERNEIAVRVRHGADLSKTLGFVLAKSSMFNDGGPMSFEFFDDRLDDFYSSDYRFARMIGYFTALAMFITCLGLFGVSLFVIQMRTKEIGIRKVMGASVGTVLFLVAKEFIILISISTIIGLPIAAYFINGWLENYAYRVAVDASLVLATLLAAVVVVLAAISYQALRAATANPVEALRYE